MNYAPHEAQLAFNRALARAQAQDERNARTRVQFTTRHGQKVDYYAKPKNRRGSNTASGVPGRRRRDSSPPSKRRAQSKPSSAELVRELQPYLYRLQRRCSWSGIRRLALISAIAGSDYPMSQIMRWTVGDLKRVRMTKVAWGHMRAWLTRLPSDAAGAPVWAGRQGASWAIQHAETVLSAGTGRACMAWSGCLGGERLTQPIVGTVRRIWRGRGRVAA